MNLTTGTALRNGKYEIGTLVGQGCFHITYQATHVSSKKPVLIEALNESWRTHPQFNLFQRRFVERVRQVAKCRHPHFIRVFDLFAEQGLVYMVTENIGSQTLASLLSDGKPLPLPEAIHWIRQVASALRILHQQGVLHLNIKPSSIVRRPNSDRVVLTDFSIADRLSVGAIQTQAGMLSAGYAPPEQYDPHKDPIPATDVYSLAATLYHLLTGQPPACASLRDRIPLANIRQVQPDLSPGLERAILQGLELSLDRRPPSIEAWMNPLWREFSTIEAYLPAVASPPAPPMAAPQPQARPHLPPSPPPPVAAKPHPDAPPELSKHNLPPQLQPWIPALFAATSVLGAIGGASFVFARQSNIATAPSPEFARLRAAFPSRSSQANFGPDPAFAEAADPQTIAEPRISPPLSPDAPLEETSAETADGTHLESESEPHTSEILPVGASEEIAPTEDFEGEVGSRQSRRRRPTPAVTSPTAPESEELTPEDYPTDDPVESEGDAQRRRPRTWRSPEPPLEEDSQPEEIPSIPAHELPQYSVESPVKPPAEADLLPQSTTPFAAPKQLKTHTVPETGRSAYWSGTTGL